MTFQLALFCVLVMHLRLSSAASNSGREFVVVFLEHVIRRSNLDFYITTGLATNVSVEISAPGLPSKQAPIRLTLTHGITSHAAVNTNLALKGTQKAKKGIFISSDGDISVQCYTTSTHSAYPNSVGGYLALPTDALGKEYMITTYCEANSCAFAVVGTEDDTQVQLVLKLPPSKRVRYSGTNYYSGDTISETIDRFEAIELMSSGSFSGTVVTSSRNVAVFIGTDFSSVGEGSSMDAMTEQLAPLDTWGMDYFLVPFPGRSTFDLLTVTAQFNNTLVELNGTRHTIMEEGTSINLKLPSDAPAYLWSNKRVLVLQLSTSHGSDTDFTDPSMLAVPPIKQWSSGYTFASSSTTSNAEDVALALIANTSCVSEVSLSHGLQLVHLNWTVVAGVGYSISYTTLQDGFYEVRTLAPGTCPSFGGYLYGPGYNFAWSMPIGQSFKILPDKRDDITSSMPATESATPILAPITTFSTQPSATLSLESTAVSSLDTVSASSLESTDSSLETTPTSSLGMLLSLQTTITSSETNVSSLETIPTSSLIIATSPLETKMPSFETIASSLETTASSLDAIPTSSLEAIPTSSLETIASSLEITPTLSLKTTASSLETIPSSYLETAVPTTSLETTGSPSFEAVTNILPTPASPTLSELSTLSVDQTSEIKIVLTTYTAGFIISSMTSYGTTTIESPVSESVADYHSSLQSSSTLTPDVAIKNSVCSCKCKASVTTVEEIKQKLKIDKSILSSTKRKYYSVSDNRPTSVAIGTSGVVFIAVTLLLITCSDFLSGIQYLVSVFKKSNNS